MVPHEPSSFRDEQEFAFRHGLIRDGAYDSLPKSLRADKHLAIAKWAADRAGDRAEEIAELIATPRDRSRALPRRARRAATRDRAGGVRACAGRPPAARRRFGLARRARAGTARPSAWQTGLRSRFRSAASCFGSTWREPVGRGPASPRTNESPAARSRCSARLGDAARVRMGDRPSGQSPDAAIAPRRGRSARAATQSRCSSRSGDSPELAHALHRLGWFLWRRGRTARPSRSCVVPSRWRTRSGDLLVRAEATQTLAVCLHGARQALGRASALWRRRSAWRRRRETTRTCCAPTTTSSNIRYEFQGPRETAEVVREGWSSPYGPGRSDPLHISLGRSAYMEQLMGRLI